MTDWIEGLERLKLLKEQGHLSDSEFEAAKSRLLGDKGVVPTPMPSPAQPYTDDLIEEVAPPPPVETAYEPSEGVEPTSIFPKAVVALLAIVLLGGGGFLATWYLAGGANAAVQTAQASYSDINCRSQASVQGDVQEVITKGSTVHISAEDSGWGQVQGKGCWVRMDNLKISDTMEQAASSETATDTPTVQTADLQPGNYHAYKDGSGGSNPAMVAKLCAMTTMIDKSYGVTPMSAWVAEGGPLGRIVQNGGVSYGKIALDDQGVCRQQVNIDGIDGGDSYTWRGVCRVTGLRVYEDKAVGLSGLDKYDCI
ncbi:SHOCT domain-containing protein [Sphingobium sp. TCM1]|uniref:SHOCT domain-containing protein n=1 Tax=Sphingobium sp. TCM1 TaxID=453246 RepID=UPI0007F455D1|nr:SHOCT domain-containing protein [Sphingobium sp. TCM1]OAN51865.1 hypothetical protein A7Q26_09230 [Sphingobium sp. TCM1]